MQEGGDEKKGGFFSIRGEEGRGEEKMCGRSGKWKELEKKKENAEALQHANLPRWYHCSFLLNLELYIGE